VLTIDTFIEKSLKHPKSYFRYLLESIIDEQITDIRDELKSPLMGEFNPELLVEEINFTSKENQQKKLKVLFDQLNTERYRVKKEIQKNQESLIELLKIIDYLEQLKVKFFILYKSNKLIKIKFFINEIDDKMILLKNYSIALSFKGVNLLEIERIYRIEIKGY